MFDQSYKFEYKNNRAAREYETFIKEHKLTFKAHNNHKYIVNVEEYVDDFFVIKFFLKQHSKSEDRYHLTTELHDAPRIIRTCVNIMIYFYQKNALASFGFIGANSVEEAK